MLRLSVLGAHGDSGSARRGVAAARAVACRPPVRAGARGARRVHDQVH